MNATLAVPLASIVTILACILYLMTGVTVARMRGKHKIDAPAVTGHPEFERAYRVQMNTLEAFPIFLSGLWLASLFMPARLSAIWWLPAALGVAWIIGRYMYMQGYLVEPSKRSTGFLISALAQIVLLLLALVGTVMSWPSTGTV
jgi:glutathione S-transferase